MLKSETRNLRMLPTSDEALLDTVAYSCWIRSESEDADSYVRRRKMIDLAQLVHQVVEEELSESQRLAIRMRYYDRLPRAQIAERMHVQLPAVTKLLQRAEEHIRQSLKYVIWYQYDMRCMEVLPCAVREALVTAAGRYGDGRDVGARLQMLRQGEHLSLEAAAAGTKIDAQRLQALENGSQTPDCGELLRLSAYYDVTCDRILKGVSA